MVAKAERLSRSKFLKVTMVVFLIVLGTSYVYKINDTSTKGYLIHDLETKVKELQRENQRLSIQAAEHSAMHTVKKRVEALGMQEPAKGEVEYVKKTDGAVAKR